jgi:hypothetical protein
MIYENLKGKRYIALVRCSSPHQADTSIPDQLRLLAAFAEENQMVRVDDVVLDGVTGSIPGARNDIAELIRRKEEKDDFDVLLVQDLSRFTRGGAEHGMKLEYDLLAVGVQVVFVSDNLPEGDHSGIIKSVGFYAAKQHAKAISFAAARGQMSALTQGRTVYCSAPPYAIDRLYVAANGRPLHIIRNLPDGTQHKLDPNSKAIMGTFRRNDVRGHSNHYRRQANEHVVLVPGADEQVETVRDVYRWSLVEGWGHWRIAKELNARGIPSATVSGWSTSSVANILRNPIYTGYGIANRYTLAVYNMRSPNSPCCRTSSTSRASTYANQFSMPPPKYRPR